MLVWNVLMSLRSQQPQEDFEIALYTRSFYKDIRIKISAIMDTVVSRI